MLEASKNYRFQAESRSLKASICAGFTFVVAGV